MKKTLLLIAMALGFGMVSLPIAANAHMGFGGGGGHGTGMGYGGMMGGHMGSGMMGGGHMGPGMQWGDRGEGRYGGPYDSPRHQLRRPLEEKDARAIVEDYLRSTRNPNLKLGRIEDKGAIFEAEIVTKDDSLVDKIAVDKRTGSMRSTY